MNVMCPHHNERSKFDSLRVFEQGANYGDSISVAVTSVNVHSCQKKT
jgi:hypothetical protein